MDADNSAIASFTAIMIAVGLPIFMKWMDNRNSAKVIKAKEEREDELSNRMVKATELVALKVEEQAKKAADLLVTSNAKNIEINTVQAEGLRRVELQAQEAARLMLESNAKLVETSVVQAATLKEISDTGKTTHILVNNNLTMTKRQARDGYVLAVTSLKRTEALARRLGESEDPAVRNTLMEVEAKIIELTKEIDERDKVAGEVTEMMKNQAAENVHIQAAAEVDRNAGAVKKEG